MNARDRYARALRMVKRSCEKVGVEVRLTEQTQITIDGHSVSGYFDPERKILAVAVGGDPFLAIGCMLHEHSHMEQWYEDSKNKKTAGAMAWRRCRRAKEDTHKEAMATMAIELDAERRTVRKLRKYGLGTKTDLKQYIKAAALYVWSHHVLYEHQSWFKRSISLSQKARELSRYLPSTLRGSFLEPPPEPLNSLIGSWLK